MFNKISDLIFKNGWWKKLIARITIAYALGTLVLSAAVAYLTYTIAKDRLLSDFEQASLEQFNENASETKNGLSGLPENPDPETSGSILSSIDEKIQHTSDSDSILILENIGVRLTNRNSKEIPDYLTNLLKKNPIASTYYSWEGEKRYIIGARLNKVNGFIDANYHEIYNLTSLDSTLTQLRNILILSAIVSSIAGATLGYYSANRALSPISRVSSTAREIADGNFNARLDPEIDPDLAVLSSSFNEMVSNLKQRIERDQRFTSDVSHELRSPLMTLTASIELLERKKDQLPDTAQQAVELLSEDISRFQNLVEDLLEISRMDAGADQIQLNQFKLLHFLESYISQSIAPDTIIRYSSRDKDLEISADKRRIAQVLRNLFINAEKYAGGVKIVSFRSIGESVQIVVEDEGPGVSSEDRIKIFERFSRGSNIAGNRASGSGVGLGLSLVAEHVRLHGGKVWVTDRIDGKSGARFVVELPLGEIITSDEEMAI